MKHRIIILLISGSVFIQTLFPQINLFNFYKPYQGTTCCPVNTYGLELQMNYSILDINTAELQIPVSLFWSMIDNFEIGGSVSGISRSDKETVDKGISDILFATKYNFLKEEKNTTKTWPTISAELGLSFPTGDYKKGFGTGGIGIIVLWLFEKEVVLKTQHYFNLLINLGYKYNTTNPDDYRYGESLLYSFSSWFNLTNSFRFYFGLKGDNKKKDVFNNKEVNNSEKFESYIYSGINYDLDEYRKFFSAIFLGITEDAKDLIFNIGMMY
jgi:hypothetical protein